MSIDYTELTDLVLSKYPISHKNVEYIRHNENYTCRVYGFIDDYLLRIHRSADGISDAFLMHSYQNLSSEIQFLNALGMGTDITLQKPVANMQGEFITKVTVDDKIIYATLLTWLPGNLIDINSDKLEDFAYKTGAVVAKMHDFSLNYCHNNKLSRPKYNGDRLEKAISEIKNGIELGLLTDVQYGTFCKTSKKIIECIQELDKRPDSWCIIHADIQKTNLIINSDKVSPIDFCLCGYGHTLQDLGFISADFNSSMHKALLDGYRSIRSLTNDDIKYIEAFFIYAIISCMAIHLNNPYMKDWFLKRMQPICDDFLVPFLSEKSFYYYI